MCLSDVDTVARELLVAERLGPARELAGDRMPRTAFSAAMLHRLDLDVIPVLAEGAQDAAMTRLLPKNVVRAFPNTARGEMRRIFCGDLPLVGGIVRNSAHADLTSRPRLCRRPLDALHDVVDFTRRARIEKSRRPPSAARIDTQNRIPVGHPALGIDGFPVEIFAARIRQYVRMIAHEALVRRNVAFPKGQSLAVRPVGEDHRMASFGRPKEVGS